MKKILYVILNGVEYGGSEKHVVDLINKLDKSKYEVSLIMSQGNEMYKSIDKNNCRKIYQINRNSIFAIENIKKIIKKEKPNIVHAHAARAMFMVRIASKKAVKKKKLKLICTAHGWVLKYLKFNKIKEKLFLLNRKIDSVTLAVSKYSMNEMIYHGYSPLKMQYIYNGINVKEYNKKARVKKFIKNINFIGRLTDQKGIIYLMDAILKLKNSNYIFNIYGKGEKEQYIKNFIQKNNIKNVTINGFIPSNEVINILNETDILLLPSIDEGFPYILVEAISAGVPCIATNVGGVSEIITNQNGKIIDSRNVEQIVESINEFDNCKIHKKSLKCIDDSVEFDISTMINKISKVYDGV